MIINCGPRGRVYTYTEVRELVARAKMETTEALLRNQEPLNKALCADHERAMLVLCLRALQMDGFQKAPMERMMGRVADLTDAMASGTLDYDKDILKPVEDCLGYEIEADGLLEELEKEIR